MESHDESHLLLSNKEDLVKYITELRQVAFHLEEVKEAYEDTIEKIAEGFGEEDCLNYGITLIDAIADLLKDSRAYKWCNEKLKKQNEKLKEENEELKLSVKVLESHIQGEEEYVSEEEE
tara:strand:+ start:103 stop:462 length:360 start_codon:yes stop_codon:yes gene_type:complete